MAPLAVESDARAIRIDGVFFFNEVHHDTVYRNAHRGTSDSLMRRITAGRWPALVLVQVTVDDPVDDFRVSERRGVPDRLVLAFGNLA